MEDTSQLREAVQFTRDEKGLVNAYDVEISGRVNTELNEIISEGYLMLDQLEEKNEHLITDKFSEIEDYVGLTYDELRDHHKKGFRKLLVGDYRLNAGHQPERIEMLKDPDVLEDLAIGYSFDYMRTLTLARKLGVTPNTALRIASFAYKNEPNILITLAHTYPDADPGLIKNAVRMYQHPEQHIKMVLELIPKLQGKFPDLEVSFIKAAAYHHYTNPEQYLEDSRTRLEEMMQKFPNADMGLIKAAVINYQGKAESFIENAQKKFLQLKKTFPDIDADLCKSAVLGYPTDPEGFVVAYSSRLKQLQRNHEGNIGIAALKKAAYSPDPEARLKKILKFQSDNGYLDQEFDEIEI